MPRIIAPFLVTCLVSTQSIGQLCVPVEDDKLLAPTSSPGGWMGYSVSVDSLFSVCGAPTRDSVANLGDPGAAFVYTFDGNSWVFDDELYGSDQASLDNFGTSVEVDSDTIVIGAPGSSQSTSNGKAYIYKHNGSSWIEEQIIIASDGSPSDDFGRSVAVSQGVVVIGSPSDDDNGDRSGSAYVFRDSGAGWVQEVKIIAPDAASLDRFGAAVAINKNLLAIGAWGDDGESGSVYLYEYSGSGWVFQQKIIATDRSANSSFGFSLSITDEWVLVGSWADDSSGTDSGSAYIFAHDGIQWIQAAKLIPVDIASGDRFARSVSVSGDIVLVGSYTDDDNGLASGSAYVYLFDGSQWAETAKLLASDGAMSDWFGWGVDINDDVAFVGAWGDDDGGQSKGSVYVYELNHNCIADFNNDCSLDFFDTSAFLDAYNALDLSADLNGDGSLDFFDVSAFLTAFNNNCS